MTGAARRLALVHDATRVVVDGVPLVLGVEPPFPVEARVLEDDRFHVLAADPAFRDPGEHPVRVHTGALEVEPAALGSVVARGGDPPALLAVVHDLDETPTCQARWVRLAYGSLLEEVGARGVASLSLPLLGTRFGGLAVDAASRLLVESLRAAAPACLERVFVPIGEGDARQIYEALRGAAGSSA